MVIACRNRDDERWWQNKIAGLAEKSFNATVSRYAVRIFDTLCKVPADRLESDDPTTISGLPKIRDKYLWRALMVLTRTGLVRLESENGLRLVLLRQRLAIHKPKAPVERHPISDKERQRLFRADHYQCGHCGDTFAKSELEIDHIVPLCLHGADEPGNWVSMCRPHNRHKWEHFKRDYLHHYRGSPVEGTIGVRSKNGFLWPYINGKIRTATRQSR